MKYLCLIHQDETRWAGLVPAEDEAIRVAGMMPSARAGSAEVRPVADFGAQS